ncbi:hypothetical protein SH2C18_35150 [Clostridium sediminicola]
MVFILFEIASDYKFDLDDEWSKGRKHIRGIYLLVYTYLISDYIKNIFYIVYNLENRFKFVHPSL